MGIFSHDEDPDWGTVCELEADIKQLKAENERLKEELESLDRLQKLDHSYVIRYRNLLSKYVGKYKQTLQEIRTIAEDRTKTEDYLLGQEYTDLVDNIIDLITKVESEG